MSIASKRIVLEEQRRAFNSLYSAGDVLDGKLESIMNFSSVIVAITSTLITVAFQQVVGIVFWILLFLVLLLYIWLFYIIRKGVKPANYPFPISRNLATLKAKYFPFKEERALDQAILDHENCIKIADEINTAKAKEVYTASNLMFTIVVCLLLAVILGLIYPSPTLVEFFSKAMP